MVIFPRVALKVEFSSFGMRIFLLMGKIVIICYYIYMKSRKNILSLLATSAIFLCVINFIALKGLWYYLFWYFDMPMHFIGGMTVLFLLVYIFYNKISTKQNIPVGQLLLAVFFIGFSWEIYEQLVSVLISHNPQIYIDSISDIFFDLAGGVFGLLYIMKK
jgi:hypothetical protein